MATFNQKVEKAIPGLFFMISSSEDHQTSNEAYNTSAFELPNPAGKAGGACTSAFLQVLYENPERVGKMSWTDVLEQMGKQLKSMGYDQTPQLSSSRYIDVNDPMHICPPKSGRRRAILIGINYVGQKGELKACHNDVKNLKEYLIKVQGFDESQMLVLLDDGNHIPPTKKNIEDAFVRMTQYSQPGDVVFVSFSGHGGQIVDRSGDEEDGFDETIIPVDFKTNGQIIDDDILEDFVKPMRKGVTCTILMDCCHSGTVLDLPYCYSSGDNNMKIEKGFQFEPPPPPEQAKNSKQKKGKKNKKYDDGSESSDSTYDGTPKYNQYNTGQTKDYAPQPRAPSNSQKEPDNLPPPPKQCCTIL